MSIQFRSLLLLYLQPKHTLKGIIPSLNAYFSDSNVNSFFVLIGFPFESFSYTINFIGIFLVPSLHNSIVNDAVEFDFASKWAESIGQAEHYAKMTGKKVMVVLILEDPNTEMVYYNRVKEIATLHNFDTEYITPEILHLVEEKCQYLDCKCNRPKSSNFIKNFFNRYFSKGRTS